MASLHRHLQVAGISVFEQVRRTILCAEAVECGATDLGAERLLKEDDITLQSLKEEWSKEIHDIVVEALTELQEHNPSGCYMVSELWNFKEKRKAALDEVVREILQNPAIKVKPRTQPQKKTNAKGI